MDIFSCKLFVLNNYLRGKYLPDGYKRISRINKRLITARFSISFSGEEYYPRCWW
jgi:hypothetical protein